MFKEKKEREKRIRVERYHRPWIQQQDLIVVIFLSGQSEKERILLVVLKNIFRFIFKWTKHISP